MTFTQEWVFIALIRDQALTCRDDPAGSLSPKAGGGLPLPHKRVIPSQRDRCLNRGAGRLRPGWEGWGVYLGSLPGGGDNGLVLN